MLSYLFSGFFIDLDANLKEWMLVVVMHQSMNCKRIVREEELQDCRITRLKTRNFAIL